MQSSANVSVSDQDQNFPDSFFCPLSHELMRDPVIDHEGNSYERVCIENWLLEHNTSPITRNPLSKDKLAPNRALREAIDERCQKLGVDPRKNTPAPVPKAAAPASPAAAAPLGSNNGPVSISVRKAGENYNVLVSIQSPDGSMRTPVDVCCVVDISGSMDTEATLKTNSGKAESHGLSLLDVVKHAVKTVVSTLQQNDRLSLVSFSDSARVECDLTYMDDSGKQKLLKAVEALHTEGSTNLWDGLDKGLQTLAKHTKEGRQSCVMLLTDGQPNVTPPRGELGMLKLYKEKNNGLQCSVSMFGFGYGINSELLRDLSNEGGGMYAFIPDASFVGTAFVHATANLLVTRAREVSVSFEPQNDASLVAGPLLGGHSHSFTSWGGVASIGALQYGQSKDVVLRMKIPAGAAGPFLSVTVKYVADKFYEFTAQASLPAADSAEVEVQRLRLHMVDSLVKAAAKAQANDFNAAKSAVAELVSALETSAVAADPRIVAYLQDVKGQATEAVSRADWFGKWGRHYLPSLARAHLLQQCNNFKDPGVQVYGGAFFKKQRDIADELFCKLPPPKPSVKKPAGSNSRPVASMSSYHNRSNPCFHGKCLVQLADGSRLAVQDVRRGTRVQTPDGEAEVLCVVKTHCPGTSQLVQLDGGLLITPYHPVRVAGRWHFPCDLKPASTVACDAVYSFALTRGHVMLIDGVECVTLGHSFQDDVVRHPYFGSQQIIDDLRSLPGWQKGLVEFAGACMVKNEQSGFVCGFVEQLALPVHA